MPEWSARNLVPDEVVPEGLKTTEPLRYGMPRWRDMFSPRQLFGHCTSVEVFQELMEASGGAGSVNELDAAAFTYLAIAMDKMLNYNSRMSVWMPTREVVANTFNRHDFAFCWSYAEMAPCVVGLGYDWTTEQTGKALEELIELAGGETIEESETPLYGRAINDDPQREPPRVTISHGSGDSVSHLLDGTIDAVVIDPPYGANVMYAELADFFYVWLKRTAGLLFPEQFQDQLTDKDREAVANPAKFKDHTRVRGSGGAMKRATQDYRERMQGIFAEARRVLKPDGIMTLMFTHKATGAWDALAKGLVDAGFVITASWPVNTEAEGSLHIKDKNAAKSTIFLICRPRLQGEGHAAGEQVFWEDVEPKVEAVVLERVEEFQKAGMRGVDLYLSCFGPALQVFSENWPMTRGRPVQRPDPVKGANFKLVEEEDWDPYAVRPEDALLAARRAVKQWRLTKLSKANRQTALDPLTEWYVLAWDAFGSPQFPADEALKLARVVGINFDDKLRNKVLEVKGGDVILWDSVTRSRKDALGGVESGQMLDALHKAAQLGRERNTGAAKDLVERANLLDTPQFKMALEAMLAVLPTPRALGGKANAAGGLAGAIADSTALEQLRRLALAKDVPPSDPWLIEIHAEEEAKKA